MGFLKKKKHNNEEGLNNVSEPVVEDIEINESDSTQTPTRDEFHKMAEENLMEAIAEENISEETDEITDNVDTTDGDIDLDGDDFMDDDVPHATNTSTKTDEVSTNEIEKEPRVPIGMKFKEFMKRHNKAFKITSITLGAILVVLIGIYVYGCNTLTAPNVMGRNIYIENINVSGLTYEEALDKIKGADLLKNYELKLISNGKTFVIDGKEAGLTVKPEETVDLAMRYGKTNNILIDGLANTLQYFFPHKVLPMANADETVIRAKLTEFGKQVHGELVPHKMEIAENGVICTPGKSGFSGNVDNAYNQVVAAINSENFSRIRVTFDKTEPQPITFEELNEFGKVDAQNARYEIVNGETTIVDEVVGKGFDESTATALLSNLREGGSVITIPYIETEPKLKKEDLNDSLFNATLGSYTTSYYAGGNRGQNVAIAASKINEIIILPGEVFSFNDTVGRRSVANGFKPAEEYSNGETVIGIGGGTCQVSTTLYNAVLYADLPIVYRLNHMFAIGYAPLGQDATVSDTGVDFKFSNNTEHPIKITSVTGGGKITVSIVGTERDVKHTVKIENITSYVAGGRSVRSYRYVYDPNGELIRKDDLGKSYYMDHHKEEPTVAPTETSAPEDTPTDTPSDIPTTDTPVVDTPAVDTPVVDTPVVDTPVAPPAAEPVTPPAPPSGGEVPAE